MKHLFLCMGISISLFTACTPLAKQENTYRVWSDQPAYTCLFENQEPHESTSDIFDNQWEGDSIPSLPRVPNPTVKRKQWPANEGVDYLHEETFAATGGKYNNPVRLWEGEGYPIGNGRLAASAFHGSGRDRYTLNEVSFWSGAATEVQSMHKATKALTEKMVPRLQLMSLEAINPSGCPVDFHAPAQRNHFIREIRLNHGELYASRPTGRSDVFQSCILQLCRPGHGASLYNRPTGKTECRPVVCKQRKHDVVSGNQATLTLSCLLANGISPEAKVTCYPYGGSIQNQGEAIQIKQCDSCTILIAIETNYQMDFAANWRGENPQTRIHKRMEAIKDLSFHVLQERHRSDFHSLFNRLTIDLPESADSLQRLPTPYRLQNYRTAASDPD